MSNNAVWTFSNLREEKLQKMSIDGGAGAGVVAGAKSGWSRLAGASLVVKSGVVVAFLLVVVGLPLVVAAAAGAFSGSNAEASTIVLRTLTYTCTDPAQTADYTSILGASGSSFHARSAWEGTLYIKGDGSGGCVTENSDYNMFWPPVTANSSAVPKAPAGVTATLAMSRGADGYYFLLINGCVSFHYSGNTADSWVNSISPAWPVIEADGSTQIAAPACAAPP